MNTLKYFLVFTLLSSSIFADVTLPSIFSEYMVLQQESKNLIWGWAYPNEKVTVSTSWGENVSTITDNEGKWNLLIPTPSYRSNQSIKIQGTNSIDIANVNIGEVWLAVGQSNMGWGIENTFNGDAEIEDAKKSNIRFYNPQSTLSSTPLNNQDAKWQTVNSEDIGRISAISFYFANKLYHELKIPIGVVVEAYAGTSVELWMPKEIQMDDKITLDYITGASGDKARYAKYVKKCNAKYKKDPVKFRKLKDKPPFEETYNYPGNTFNAMINPIVGYGIKGMIYYQGERNSKRIKQAEHYETQLPKLFNYYRSIWSTRTRGNVSDSFSCYFIQLPSYKGTQELPVENDTWPVMRDVMRKIANSEKNCDMAVTIDTGDEVVLHPHNKKPGGVRLAYLALKNDYNRKIVSKGPVFKNQKIKGSKIELTFDTQGAEIVTGRDGMIDAFAIAGSDGKWFFADKVKISKNIITVSSEKVKSPVAVRYAWSQNPSKRNLIYNEYGLPASPFRTDKFKFDNKIHRPIKPKKHKGYVIADWSRPAMPQ